MKLGEVDSDMLLFGGDDGDVSDDMSLFDNDVEHDFENDFDTPNVSEELNNEEAPDLTGIMAFFASLANSFVRIALPNFIAEYPLGTILPQQLGDFLHPHYPHAYTIHVAGGSSRQDDPIKYIKYLFAMNVQREFEDDTYIQSVLEDLCNELVRSLVSLFMACNIAVDTSTAPITLSNANPLYPLGTLLPRRPRVNIHQHVDSPVQDSDDDDAIMYIKYLFFKN